MTEYLISDEMLATIRRTCYEAGKAGKEVFSVRSPRAEIVRCGDCVHAYDQWDYLECELSSGDYFAVEPEHFCAWGIRRESEGE